MDFTCFILAMSSIFFLFLFLSDVSLHQHLESPFTATGVDKHSLFSSYSLDIAAGEKHTIKFWKTQNRTEKQIETEEI